MEIEEYKASMADLIERGAVLSDINEEIEANQEYPEDKLIRKGLRIARKSIENAPTVNRWIPCSEELPASICRVLVTTFAGNVGVAVFNPEKKRWYKNGEFYDLRLIIAWQPMPDAYEPPEKE